MDRTESIAIDFARAIDSPNGSISIFMKIIYLSPYVYILLLPNLHLFAYAEGKFIP
jgi:hypothetical protein